MNKWPLQSQCDAFYGNPRGLNGHSNKDWEKNNLVSVQVPFKMMMDSVLIKRITIHKKCASSLSRILAALWAAAGKDQKKIDLWGVSVYSGSYNYRPMRTSNRLSMHAYGAAVDLDAPRKPLGQSKKRFDPVVVKCFRDEGWVNLPNDPMHFQAAIVN